MDTRPSHPYMLWRQIMVKDVFLCWRNQTHLHIWVWWSGVDKPLGTKYIFASRQTEEASTRWRSAGFLSRYPISPLTVCRSRTNQPLTRNCRLSFIHRNAENRSSTRDHNHGHQTPAWRSRSAVWYRDAPRRGGTKMKDILLWGWWRAF